MNLFLTVVMMLLILPSAVGASPCGPNTPFWRRYSCLQQERQIDIQRQKNIRGRLPQDTGVYRSSPLPTEGEPFCADLKTLRKQNYMLRNQQGEYAFIDTPCADNELCLVPANLKSIQSLAKVSDADIAKLLQGPKCVPVQDTTLCSDDPHHRIIYVTLNGTSYEFPVQCEKEVSGEGYKVCQFGKCVSQKTALCKDSDNTVVVNGKPNWNSIIVPGQVTLATGDVKKDVCKDESYLQEQYCDPVTGATKMAYVGCGTIQKWAACKDGACVMDTSVDTDGDGITDYKKDSVGQVVKNDNCQTTPNPIQKDGDEDGVGDACDICPNNADPQQLETDLDGFGDGCDNCPKVFNPKQEDDDKDGVGDVCACVTLKADYITPTTKLNAVDKQKCLTMLCEYNVAPAVCQWPKWWSEDALYAMPAFTPNEDTLLERIENCVTETSHKVDDTDGDGIVDSDELAWQKKQIYAFDRKFHPEHLETNPLKADTDGDGLNDKDDPCPLNPDKSCSPDFCVPPGTPSTECTAKLVYSSPVLPFKGKEQKYGITDGYETLSRVAWAKNSPNITVISSPYFVTPDQYATQVLQSSDGGKTWSESTLVNTVTKSSSGYWNNSPISMSANGQEQRFRSGSNLFESHDGGKTWGDGYYAPMKMYKEKLVPTTRMQWVSPDGSVEFAVGLYGAISIRTLPGGQWQWFSPVDGIVDEKTCSGCGGNGIYFMSGDTSGTHIFLEKNSYKSDNNFYQAPKFQYRFISGSQVKTSLTGSVVLNISDEESESPFEPTKIYFSNDFGKTFQTTILGSTLFGSSNVPMAMQPNGERAYVINFRGDMWRSTPGAGGTPALGANWEPVASRATMNDNNYTTFIRGIAVSPDGKEVIAVGNTYVDAYKAEKNVIYKYTCP